MDMDDFIAHVRQVVWHCKYQLPDTVQALSPFGGDKKRREASDVVKVYEFSNEVRLALASSPCYMCSRQPAFGIDRYDSAVGYTEANVRPCCSSCNYMKKDWPFVDVLGHINRIFSHTLLWVLGDVYSMPIKSFTGVLCSPISVKDAAGKTLIVFPSRSKAMDITGLTQYSIDTAIATGRPLKGHLWVSSTGSEYRQSGKGCSNVLSVVQMLSRK
jgi:hypothetical protein